MPAIWQSASHGCTTNGGLSGTLYHAFTTLLAQLSTPRCFSALHTTLLAQLSTPRCFSALHTTLLPQLSTPRCLLSSTGIAFTGITFTRAAEGAAAGPGSRPQGWAVQLPWDTLLREAKA